MHRYGWSILRVGRSPHEPYELILRNLCLPEGTAVGSIHEHPRRGLPGSSDYGVWSSRRLCCRFSNFPETTFLASNNEGDRGWCRNRASSSQDHIRCGASFKTIQYIPSSRIASRNWATST